MTNEDKLIRIFNENGITFWTSGKNVSEGSINVQCPFCNDHSNHCGIFKDTLIYHCWRCEATGQIATLLEKLLNISYRDCVRLIQSSNLDFKTNILDQINQRIIGSETYEDNDIEVTEIALPKFAELISYSTKSLLLNSYLKRRKISLDTLIRYNCRICEVGPYMHRMIIPVYYGGQIVSYQGADLTGKADIKYMTAPNDINNYLYNFDNVAETMILVEGVLDAWRLEDNVCASFGTSLTNVQRDLIEAKKPNTLIFCWDSDAYWKAKKQAKYFELTIKNVKVIKLPTGEDPDSLGKLETLKLIEE